jgi:uncharacterized protein
VNSSHDERETALLRRTQTSRERNSPVIVLVTGASSGIGETTARLFAAEGAQVILISQQEAELHRVAADIRQAGGRATVLVADFARPEQVEGLIACAEREVGPLDVLVNNAGVGMGATALDTPPDELRLLFEVNFFALVSLCRQAMAVMAPRGKGHIINVSSAAARFGSAGVSAYSATKGAAHAYTQALRTEASVYGIHVTEVLPISVRTKFFDNVHGEKYAPSGIVLTAERVAQTIVRCARSPRPKAEVLPYRPVGIVFVLDTLFPGLMARIAARQYQKDQKGQD